MLDGLCWQAVMNSEIDRSEIGEKEAFRQRIESIIRGAIAQYEEEQASLPGFPTQSVELKCFGSLSSGFATKASDMDLGLLSPLSRIQPDLPGSPIPRLLEKALLDAGLGARLLSRTRVPIIKLCEKPPEKLRLGLLAEREKWERGADEEPTEGHEEEDNEQGVVAHIQDNEQHADPAPTEPAPPSAMHFEVPCDDNGGTQRFHLRQGSNSSLSAYYGLAKRVLRKASGRDVNMSNQRGFTERDWAILNRVCQAFVDGLSDVDLKERLGKYPSLSFKPQYGSPTDRSLHGVFLQIEGEQILQTWNNWSFKDAFQAQHSQLDQAVKSWQFVQNASHFGVDPVTYTKELQLVLDKLRRVSSIQMVSLEQAQYETPRQYHARTKVLVSNFSSPQLELPSDVHQAVIDRYISGIYQRETRDEIKATINEWPGPVELEGVACLHKSLHLVRELERAMDKGLYQGAQLDDIRDYIKLLRTPLRKVAKAGGADIYVIPVPPNQTALLGRIRELQDPHAMAPNQPRDRYRDQLEFPKSGAGVQCDINFSAHLALHNTLLLRCYSHTDPRVRPMVLFIKHWAKARGINSGYRGTLSSYGYVLMVLHFLVNVAQPFVCPNLQQLAPAPPPNLSPAEVEATIMCKGYNVQFWRNEQEILQFARANQLNHNSDSIGHLLRGFFEYYAQSGMMSSGSGKGFDWGRDVLSLRTQGGLVTKQDKGWTGAKTVFEVQKGGATPNPQSDLAPADQQTAQESKTVQNSPPTKPTQTATKDGEVKEVRHRYLFAIEDPFELDHNVARTVTHPGIVSIRDELRRAWRIIRTAGSGAPQEDLLQDVNEGKETLNALSQLLDELHGPQGLAETGA